MYTNVDNIHLCSFQKRNIIFTGTVLINYIKYKFIHMLFKYTLKKVLIVNKRSLHINHVCTNLELIVYAIY